MADSTRRNGSIRHLVLDIIMADSTRHNSSTGLASVMCIYVCARVYDIRLSSIYRHISLCLCVNPTRHVPPNSSPNKHRRTDIRVCDNAPGPRPVQTAPQCPLSHWQHSPTHFQRPRHQPREQAGGARWHGVGSGRRAGGSQEGGEGGFVGGAGGVGGRNISKGGF